MLAAEQENKALLDQLTRATAAYQHDVGDSNTENGVRKARVAALQKLLKRENDRQAKLRAKIDEMRAKIAPKAQQLEQQRKALLESKQKLEQEKQQFEEKKQALDQVSRKLDIRTRKLIMQLCTIRQAHGT